MKKIAILLASLGLMLTGCSSQEASLDGTQTPPSNEENNNENNSSENNKEENDESNSGDNAGDENDDKENDSENNETEENPQDLETERTFSLYLNYNKDGYIITDYFGEFENVVVPNTYKDLPIVEIDNEVFKYDEFLKSVLIPNSVRKIGAEAFYYCENLESVSIEDDSQLSKIRYRAFSNCSNLKTVDLGQNPALTTIEARAFYECKSLSAFYLSDKILYVGDYAFALCDNLKIYSTFAESPTNWGVYWNITDTTYKINSERVVWAYAGICDIYNDLEYCVRFDEEKNKFIVITDYHGTATDLYLPESIVVNEEELQVKEILQDAFTSEDSLDYIFIPKTITTIRREGIYAHKKIFCEVASEPDGWNYGWCSSNRVIWNSYFAIHGYSNGFYYCVVKDENEDPYIVITEFGEEREIIVPETLCINGEDIPIKVIDGEIYKSNKIVETIILPHTVTTIKGSAFWEFDALTTLFLPNSVTELKYGIFNDCVNATIYTDYKSRPSNWPSGIYGECLVVYSSYFGVHGNYNGFNYAVCIDDNNEKYINIVRYIGTDNEVVIPESINVDGEEIPVKLIYGNAFREGNNEITSVSIPSSVTKIGYQAFMGCNDLKEVIIKDDSSLTIIDNAVFSSCLSLETIFIPSSVTTFGNDVFYNCPNLTIYCEISESESTRDSYRNGNRDVVWDTTYEEYLEVINNAENLTK